MIHGNGCVIKSLLLSLQVTRMLLLFIGLQWNVATTATTFYHRRSKSGYFSYIKYRYVLSKILVGYVAGNINLFVA